MRMLADVIRSTQGITELVIYLDIAVAENHCSPRKKHEVAGLLGNVLEAASCVYFTNSGLV